jgi:tRNA A37 methylthiotransferase MiaB
MRKQIHDQEESYVKVQIISTSCNRLILVSTCGFTQAAEDFGLKTIERIELEKKIGCEVIVGGCLPKINPAPIGNYRMIDPRNYDKLDDYTGFSNKFSRFPRPNTLGEWKLHTAYREHGIMESDQMEIDVIGRNTRKENIQAVEEISKTMGEREDTFRIQCLVGCACKCTYCAIKFAIGEIMSVPVEQIIRQVQEGITCGYKKIMLEGDSLGGYGTDIQSDIGQLLDAVIPFIRDHDVQISVPDVSPLYLSCCETQIIQLAQMDKLFNFYIPIQSGSQLILNRMKRGYRIDRTKDVILRIKQQCPDLKIGTSVIVGFPGETEEDFEATIQVCKELGFHYIYCHSYSDRTGTEASVLSDKVPGEEILRRSRVLKDALKDQASLITIAEDTKGNRTCQG